MYMTDKQTDESKYNSENPDRKTNNHDNNDERKQRQVLIAVIAIPMGACNIM